MQAPVGIAGVPLAVHARYTRTEILAAFDVGTGLKPATWQSGVLVGRAQPDRPVRVHARQDRPARSRRPRDIATTRSAGSSSTGRASPRPRSTARPASATSTRADARNERRAVRTAQHRRTSILVPRSSDVRLTPGRTPNRDYVAPAPPPARRSLRRVRRCRGLERLQLPNLVAGKGLEVGGRGRDSAGRAHRFFVHVLERDVDSDRNILDVGSALPVAGRMSTVPFSHPACSRYSYSCQSPDRSTVGRRGRVCRSLRWSVARTRGLTSRDPLSA